jgi:hypothetical protein
MVGRFDLSEWHPEVSVFVQVMFEGLVIQKLCTFFANVSAANGIVKCVMLNILPVFKQILH